MEDPLHNGDYATHANKCLETLAKLFGCGFSNKESLRCQVIVEIGLAGNHDALVVVAEIDYLIDDGGVTDPGNGNGRNLRDRLLLLEKVEPIQVVADIESLILDAKIEQRMFVEQRLDS